MTALLDITSQTNHEHSSRTIGLPAWITRASRSLIGTSLVLVAFGLWLAPGGSWDADVATMKLGLSVFAAFAGFAVLSGYQSETADLVEVDTIRREIRLVRGKGSDRKLVRRTAVSDLSRAEVNGKMIRMWDANEELVAEVSMSDPAVRNGLMSALRDESKL